MQYQIKDIIITPFMREKHMTEKYRNWMNNPKVTKFNSWGLFAYTKKQQEEFVNDLENSTTKIVWAIEIEIENGKHTEHIGNCSLQCINYLNRSAEFAIVIGDTDYWGKGVATFALSSLLKHAFLKLGLHRVWSGTVLNNIGMQKAMEKCGMKQEGVWRDGAFLDGVFTDMPYYSILEYEYKEEK